MTNPQDTTDDFPEVDIKGGPIYDTENGDSPPESFYNGEGMYLGDGVWVSMDFFD